MKTRYKHIHFVQAKKEGVWNILNNGTKTFLGAIVFFKSCNEYVAEFAPCCVFNEQCLTDIADFLKQLEE